MVNNPFATRDPDGAVEAQTPVGLEPATVRKVYEPDGTADSAHVVEVEPDFHDEHTAAEVVVPADGSVSMPEEQDRVLLSYQENGRPQVLGTRYPLNDVVPQANEGERIVGHSGSDASVTFRNDGSVTLTNDAGDTMELQADGTVVVNDGTEQPIVDVQTTTDGDGHVTSVSLTRSSDVLVNE